MIYEFRQPTTMSATPRAPGLTPAERALLTHAGPTYIEAAEFGLPESTLSAAVEPDDWRLYYLLRELPEQDRARVLEFAELLYNLRHAQRWASGEAPAEAP